MMRQTPSSNNRVVNTNNGYAFNLLSISNPSITYGYQQQQPQPQQLSNIFLLPNILVPNSGLFAVIQPANININQNYEHVGQHQQQQLPFPPLPLPIINNLNVLTASTPRQPEQMPPIPTLPLIPQCIPVLSSPQSMPSSASSDSVSSLQIKDEPIDQEKGKQCGGKYKYQCTKCEKSFKRKTNLNAHQKVHTDYAFVCSWCNKKFARNGNL